MNSLKHFNKFVYKKLDSIYKGKYLIKQPGVFTPPVSFIGLRMSNARINLDGRIMKVICDKTGNTNWYTIWIYADRLIHQYGADEGLLKEQALTLIASALTASYHHSHTCSYNVSDKVLEEDRANEVIGRKIAEEYELHNHIKPLQTKYNIYKSDFSIYLLDRIEKVLSFRKSMLKRWNAMKKYEDL